MKLEAFETNQYKLVENKEYGYIHIDPLPSDKMLKDFYDTYYSSEHKGFNNSALEVQTAQSYYTKSRWSMIYKRFVEFFKDDVEKADLIDIGCGFSQAILYFREKGISVRGVEPSPAAVEYGKSQNLDITSMEIEKFLTSHNDKKYNIVTMFEVLEHLRNPEKILLDIKNNLISDDGLLVIDVPNDFNEFQLIANSEYKLGNWWVSPPAHVNYFSVDSLKNLLDLCGFEIKYMQASFPLEMFMLMGDVYVGDGKCGTVCHEKRVNFERLLREHGKEDLLIKYYESLAELNLGRNITVFATAKK